MKFGIGIFYGWIFIVFFGLISLVSMKVYPKHYSQRLFTLPTFTNLREKVFSVIYAVLFNSTMIVACFLPIGGGIFLFIGIIVYIFSLFCIIMALHAYARTNPNIPVTNGIYKLSRHPQQVFACIMLIGIGFALKNPVIICSCILQLLLIYPSMIAQERFCLEKYGADYEKYLSETPRYFLFI